MALAKIIQTKFRDTLVYKFQEDEYFLIVVVFEIKIKGTTSKVIYRFFDEDERNEVFDDDERITNTINEIKVVEKY